MGAEKDDSIARDIMRVYEEAQPSTMRELVRLVKARYPKLTVDDIIADVRKLSTEGELVLMPPSFTSFSAFFFNLRWNSSFWVVGLAGISATISFLATTGPPWSLFRLPMVLLILFYLPGHGFLRIISPRAEFTLLERTLLDFATSLVMIFLVGLLLNFSHLGFFALPTISSMLFLDFALGLVASFQYYSIVRSIRGGA